MTMPLNPVEREFSPELDKLAAELAKHIKTEQDLTALSALVEADGGKRVASGTG